ncbi:MAG: aminopeptidase [Actinobacteria bacterium]|nr:aminopeptidase [Actinomycetota bacterium]MBM3713604.1 aminopeptidase [Actinomycetota bacterium]
MDPGIKKLAGILVNYSCRVQKDEKVLIECFGSSPFLLLKAIIKEVYRAGGIPFVTLKDNTIIREILKECSQEQLKYMAKIDLAEMKGMQAYIGIRAHDNINELADLPAENMAFYMKHYSEAVTDWRVNHTKWVVLRYPNNSMAQLANTSFEAFETFYFNVCNLDYSKMSKAMDSLVELMDKTDIVNIKGPGTDLTFSIKDIPAVKCAGEQNIPDGEVFTAPVKNSVNGFISFNIPQVYQGVTYGNIRLELKNGRIIKAESDQAERLNKVFDTDRGARYIGEFAIGLNPHILKPMKDALFDEKIMGSFHFTPGKCYREADNKNRSALHWDLIAIQTPEYGGGEIYFNGALIRKDGKFVLESLKCLNPEKLK